MEKIIDRWKSEKNNRKKSSRYLKNIEKLGRNKHKEVENIHQQVFQEVDCLKCANCCKSIPPVVSQRDIKRISKSLDLTKKQF